MPTRRSLYRRRQKTTWERFKDNFRAFTAFMFSNVGIILLVILYTTGGAFIFQAIEITEHEKLKASKPHKFIVHNYTAEYLTRIWNVTVQSISFVDHAEYKRQVNKILLEYQRVVYNRTLEETDIEKQWSFSGAFLYSLTVITTIGYGHISPKSDWGKLVTILYAIIGMPLFLLYLSNIGDVLAKSFKWIYSKVCLCRICPGVARRRQLREQRKLLQEMAMSKALQEMESGGRSKTRSYSKQPPSLSALKLEEDLEESSNEITVPLTVCVMIMISYIVSGAILFGHWEDWNYLDGSYFCLISLSSIGFGDLVPGDRVITADKDKIEVSFILCSVYLLLGMALIVMCFNLMQEQVIHNIRAVKRAFKACFTCSQARRQRGRLRDREPSEMFDEVNDWYGEMSDDDDLEPSPPRFDDDIAPPRSR